MKIIITWGCGFIASNFLNTFVPRHPEITFLNLDAMTYAASQDNLEEATKNAPNYRFYNVDIRDMEALKEIYTSEQPTDIIHFAAESHVDNSIKNPNIFLETNILGTNNLLVLHKDFWMNRFHFISTDEVYGDLPLEKPELKFTEETPLHPHSPYSTSKAGADMLVQAFHRTYGIDTTTSRCSNNYGPRQHREKLIPRFITQLMQDAKVPLYGDGMNIRDWIHVTDHNEGVWTIFTQAKSGSIYNLWGLNEISNKEITYKLLEAFGKDENSIEFVPDRLGHDRRYAIDCSLIEKDFWWKPKYDFEKGLEETVEWYRER
jgi:dTDP-glucose 4,6-dehydratase